MFGTFMLPQLALWSLFLLTRSFTTDPAPGDGDPAPTGTDPAPTPSPAPTPAPADHMIPKARFDEVNKAKQDAEAEAARLRQQILDRETQERVAQEEAAAAAATAAAEAAEAARKAEEEEAEKQRQWQKLADKREREIGDHKRRVTELEAQTTQLTTQLTVQQEQAQGELATARAQAERYAAMVNELIDTETGEWPTEVKVLDPGAAALEQRVQWAKQARSLAQRLMTPIPPGNPRPPKPDGSAQPSASQQATDEQRARLHQTGMYSL